jgi:hypothetical protein
MSRNVTHGSTPNSISDGRSVDNKRLQQINKPRFWTDCLAEFEFSPHRHAVKQPDANDAANMQNRRNLFENL